MGKFVLSSDSKVFSFKGISLSAGALGQYLISWSDTIKPRLAIHEYLKRDGARVEYMGNAPSRFSFKFCFTGDSWVSDYKTLVASIQDDPRGNLIHPVFGNIRVACEGIPNATSEPGREINTYNLELSFVEDRVDTKIATDNQSVAQKQQAVANSVNTFNAAVVTYTSAASAGSSLSNAALAYSSAAAAVAQTSAPDQSLSTRLDGIVSAAEMAIAAIAADPLATSTAATFPAISAAEEVLDTCLQLDAALRAQRPVLVSYEVQGPIDIGSLCAQFYGKDGLARIDEVLSLNRIATPHWIPAGTVLTLASATL